MDTLPESMQILPPFRRLRTALQITIESDQELFKKDVNERSITHRLGLHLTPLFPNWDVDCEYNREGHDTKRIVGKPEDIKSSDIKGKTVYPDIIVHRRGERENLLVIEVKLSSNSEGIESDVDKVRSFVNRKLEYQFGAVVLFDVDDPAPKIKKSFRRTN